MDELSQSVATSDLRCGCGVQPLTCLHRSLQLSLASQMSHGEAPVPLPNFLWMSFVSSTVKQTNEHNWTKVCNVDDPVLKKRGNYDQ
jgi:hypothetical protein